MKNTDIDIYLNFLIFYFYSTTGMYMTFNDSIQKIRKKNNGIIKDYVDYYSGDYERRYEDKVHDGRTWEADYYQYQLENERRADEVVRSATRELADYVSIRYGSSLDIAPIGLSRAGGVINIDVPDSEYPWRTTGEGIQINVHNSESGLNCSVTCYNKIYGHKTKEAHSITDAEELIDWAVREIEPEFFSASARKNVRKSINTQRDKEVLSGYSERIADVASDLRDSGIEGMRAVASALMEQKSIIDRKIDDLR